MKIFKQTFTLTGIIALRVALAGAVVPIAATGGQAQESYNWTGMYIGVNAGYSSSSAETTTTILGVGNYFAPTSPSAINGVSSGVVDDAHFAGGVQVGINRQSGSIVYGIEADFQSFSFSGSRRGANVYPNNPAISFATENSVETDWLLTLRPRMGYSVGSALFYFTAGLALTEAKTSTVFTDTFNAGARGELANRSILTGYTIGGGVEWAWSRNWTVRGEYLFADFGKIKGSNGAIFNSNNSAPFENESSDLQAHIGRVGLNYRF